MCGVGSSVPTQAMSHLLAPACSPGSTLRSSCMSCPGIPLDPTSDNNLRDLSPIPTPRKALSILTSHEAETLPEDKDQRLDPFPAPTASPASPSQSGLKVRTELPAGWSGIPHPRHAYPSGTHHTEVQYLPVKDRCHVSLFTCASIHLAQARMAMNGYETGREVNSAGSCPPVLEPFAFPSVTEQGSHPSLRAALALTDAPRPS